MGLAGQAISTYNYVEYRVVKFNNDTIHLSTQVYD